MNRFMLCVALLFVAGGCSTQGVVPADRGTFLVSKVSAAGALGSPDALRADLYKDAADHCAAKGQQFETVEFVGTPGLAFVRATSARLQFRCVAP